jgi:Tol biopolymer transport system component
MTVRHLGRIRRPLRSLVAVVALVAAPTLPARSAPAETVEGTTTRVTIAFDGGEPTRSSYSPSLSADGRYVAFSSYSHDLVVGDHNASLDVFVRDMLRGTTTRVSVDSEGGDASGTSYGASISDDGRYVAFTSWASDLVDGDEDALSDIFVRDLVAQTTTRVNVDTSGGDGGGHSANPTISATGRYIAFESSASDLVVGDGNQETDIFVRDMLRGTTTRVSVNTEGGDPDNGTSAPAISANGRYIAFDGYASNLVPDDGDQKSDIFVRDVIAGTTTRVSVDTSGGPPNGVSWNASISATGRYVAFESLARDLIVGDNNVYRDVFVRDLATGVTTRASVDTAGDDADKSSRGPTISDTGRYVAFYSEAHDLVVGDENNDDDVFVRDLVADITTRVSVDPAGDDGNDVSRTASISPSGRYIAFDSYAWNLVVGDRNGESDVFLRDLLGSRALT